MSRQARKQNRLNGYDYSQTNHYFVTIRSNNRKKWFGEIKNNEMILNDGGNMIDLWWQEMFKKYKNISIDEYIIMPNHIHGIISIVGPSLVSARTNISNQHNNYVGADLCIAR